MKKFLLSTVLSIFALVTVTSCGDDKSTFLVDMNQQPSVTAPDDIHTESADSVTYFIDEEKDVEAARLIDSVCERMTVEGGSEGSMVAGETYSRFYNSLEAASEQDTAEEGNYIKGFKPTSIPGFKYIKFRYITKVNGRNRILSGVMMWMSLLGKSLANHTVIANHYTIGASKECPTETWPYDSYLAVERALVVNADYMGFGTSKNLDHTYCCAEATARQVVDCYRAAMQIYKAKGFKVPEKTYNLGYSQGGEVTLAVQKYIENNCSAELQKSINLQKSFCGGGPYSLEETFKFYVQKKSADYPCVIPMIIIGMKVGYPSIMSGVEVEQYFTKKILDAGILDKVRSKKYTVDELNDFVVEAVGSKDVAAIVSPEALDENNELHKKLFAAMAQNDLTKGWYPRHEVQFFHSTEDVVVPFVNCETVFAGINNSYVNALKGFTGKYGQHVDAGVKFYLKVFMLKYK